MASRVLERISRNAINVSHCLISRPARQGPLQSFSNGFHSLRKWNSSPLSKFLPHKMTMQLEYSSLASSRIQSCMFSSSASPQSNDKETSRTNVDLDDVAGDKNQSESTERNGDSSAPKKAEDAGHHASKKSEPQPGKRRRGAKRTAFSDSDTEHELSRDDLVKLVMKKEELLKVKLSEIVKMQDKVLRSYAEMENVLDRTKREAENAKKFAIQNFAKSLLDVADNLGRASLVVKESFLKIDSSSDSVGAVPLLRTLLEGVAMTEKQLADPSGTVAAVLKPGYMLYDRVLRPAEVGVTQASEETTV
ncbi:hypothetical protein J5N97_026359 [Dioscorea zingiberensis]|uniref:GrpE protein homolog n=1 Tax=Dioscorea zingiberensis TaxID=325984 RepID=A0A9D5H6L9_9LILI|nr:hypothetical protein J5N97_026359 [Dioscorea zingiberensis]